MGKDLSFPTNHVRIILAQQKGCLLHEIICILRNLLSMTISIINSAQKNFFFKSINWWCEKVPVKSKKVCVGYRLLYTVSQLTF